MVNQGWSILFQPPTIGNVCFLEVRELVKLIPRIALRRRSSGNSLKRRPSTEVVTSKLSKKRDQPVINCHLDNKLNLLVATTVNGLVFWSHIGLLILYPFLIDHARNSDLVSVLIAISLVGANTIGAILAEIKVHWLSRSVVLFMSGLVLVTTCYFAPEYVIGSIQFCAMSTGYFVGRYSNNTLDTSHQQTIQELAWVAIARAAGAFFGCTTLGILLGTDVISSEIVLIVFGAVFCLAGMIDTVGLMVVTPKCSSEN